MKKSQASLPVQQDLPVPNACAHISKASDVRAIKGLQDVRASTAASAYKTCGYAPLPVPARRADRWLQCSYSAMLALLTTRLAPLQCRVTRRHGATLLTKGSMIGGQGKACPTSLKTSFAISSR
jgi:hypothetical protein